MAVPAVSISYAGHDPFPRGAPVKRAMQCDRAAHQRSGNPGSTVPVGYGSSSNSWPFGSGEAPPWTGARTIA